MFLMSAGVVLAALTYFLGGWDFSIYTLLILITVDYITGFLRAIYDKKLNSAIGTRGIIRKVGCLALVGVATQLDYILGHTGTIRIVVIYFFVANEGLSIIENWAGMGLPIPKKLKEALEQLRKAN